MWGKKRGLDMTIDANSLKILKEAIADWDDNNSSSEYPNYEVNFEKLEEIYYRIRDLVHSNKEA